MISTVNVEILGLYIFSRVSRLLKVCKNTYGVKITFTVPFGGNTMRNANLNPCTMLNFRTEGLHNYIPVFP